MVKKKLKVNKVRFRCFRKNRVDPDKRNAGEDILFSLPDRMNHSGRNVELILQLPRQFVVLYTNGCFRNDFFRRFYQNTYPILEGMYDLITAVSSVC